VSVGNIYNPTFSEKVSSNSTQTPHLRKDDHPKVGASILIEPLDIKLSFQKSVWAPSPTSTWMEASEQALATRSNENLNVA
jgi:hypothetical protein